MATAWGWDCFNIRFIIIYNVMCVGCNNKTEIPLIHTWNNWAKGTLSYIICYKEQGHHNYMMAVSLHWAVSRWGYCFLHLPAGVLYRDGFIRRIERLRGKSPKVSTIVLRQSSFSLSLPVKLSLYARSVSVEGGSFGTRIGGFFVIRDTRKLSTTSSQCGCSCSIAVVWAGRDAA